MNNEELENKEFIEEEVTNFGEEESSLEEEESLHQEEPEEITKLANADYDAEILKGVRTAIRRKLAKEILVGDGAAGHLVGIFSANATAIDSATDIEITAIDENTLDTIVYGFGGDEDVVVS